MSGYNSFYGGRRGASFIIAAKYKTIQEMINNFSLGAEYKTVNFDEYVLIDTESKNDADNGKIFRRGYDYNNDIGGANYIGQIVGPSGLAPHTELKTIKEVKNIQERDPYSYRRGEGEYAPSENLVPGKVINSQGLVEYNDSIQWAYCSVRDENEKDSTVHIGFKFPYTVIDYEASSVDPYYNRDKTSQDFINTNLVKRVDNEQHPFYEKWKIAIPKGIKGDTLKNLKVVTANTAIEDYEGKADDIENGRKVLVYDYYNYDKNASGEPITIYLGDFNMIQDILLNEDGTLTIKYTHDNDKVYDKIIKWIKQVTLNTENGQFEIVYNDGAKYNTQLVYPTAVQVDGSTGIFKMTYTNKTTYQQMLVYPKKITVNGTTGDVEVIYTNGETYKSKLIFPNDLQVNVGGTEGEGNQKLHMSFTNGTSKDIGKPINYIIKTACNKKTQWHLYVLYSDPVKREAGPKATYEGRTDWTDLGYIGNGELGCIAAREDDATATALAEKLPPYSTWFIIED